MASVEQRLQMKREPLDKWSIREQLCLASAVARSGDQNWMSVSRALKQFGEPNRPADWFHQKNCAAQYGALLSNVETPKRKKRNSSGDFSIETPSEAILRQLKTERITELKKLLNEEKEEFQKLQDDMTLLTSNRFTEEQLDKWCREIDDEEFKKEHESIKHAQWLKERETRKLEIERAWRPLKLTTAPSATNCTPPKRKSTELENETDEVSAIESPKTLALSPLLTSLLKSPSQVQNINQAQSSILHSAITNQRTPPPPPPPGPTIPSSTNTSTNPMIASLLNSTSSNNVTVSPGIQQLVTSAISGTTNTEELPSPNPELLDDDETLRNLKIEDIANSMIVHDGPLPEIKNDVDVIISDLIADPEQHLQIDNNGEFNIELDNLDEELEEATKPEETVQQIEAKPEKEEEKPKNVDPFEFQEDPDFYQPKPKLKTPNPTQEDEQTETIKEEEKIDEKIEATDVQTGSVEIVEVPSTTDDKKSIPEPNHQTEIDVKIEVEIKEEVPDVKTSPNEEFDDEMEVKMDKEKAKRDYSRTRKKEEKDIDILLAIEKSQCNEELGVNDECKSEPEPEPEPDRSNSPWTTTEEEDIQKRRFSTPVSDSVPNSPASSILNEDDNNKEYRNWKKSIMLVYSWLAAHKYSSLFLKPITEDQAPGYRTLIYRPMDFQTIRKNIENGTIRTTIEFKRDVMLMLNNAIMYNKTNGTVYNMTREIQQEAMESIRLLLQAQNSGDTPPRRETRTSEPGSKRKRGIEENTRNKKRRDD